MKSRRPVIIAPVSPHYEGWMSAADIVIALKLMFCAVVALIPSRFWPPAARAAGRAHVGIRRRSVRVLADAALPNFDPRAVAVDAASDDYLENIAMIREILPGGWRPALALTGRETLDAALRRGTGAILWNCHHTQYDLVPKKVLVSAGYELNQLSAFSHPYSATVFGGLLLNPIRLRAVCQYLARRVIVVFGQARPAIDALRRILGENGVVMILAAGTGGRTIELPFLGGTIDLAIGAPRLAHESGAALIPVFTLADGSGGYRVELGPDLNTRGERNWEVAVAAMTERYVSLLEPVVRANPAAWQGWFHPATWRARE